MARINVSLFLVSFLVLIISPCCSSRNPIMGGTNSFQSKTWCVVQVGAPDDKLEEFIDSTCGRYNCGPIKPGGSCYEPDTLQNHASYLLDVVYRATNACNPEIGTPATKDPSFGKCQYP